MIIENDGTKRTVVLVIEDSQLWQAFFEHTLSRLKAVVLPAHNHAEACVLMEANVDLLDLVILDPCINDPFDYDAHQILPDLARLKPSGIHILGCTNDAAARVRLKLEGCTHVFPKDETRLPGTLEEVLGELLMERIVAEPLRRP